MPNFIEIGPLVWISIADIQTYSLTFMY